MIMPKRLANGNKTRHKIIRNIAEAGLVFINARPVSPDSQFRQMKFTDQGRKYVGILQIVIVVGSIKIIRHNRIIAGSMLSVK